MFILSILSNIGNGNTRRGTANSKGRNSKDSTCRTRKGNRYSEGRSSACKFTRRPSKGNGSIRSEGKQCSVSSQALTGIVNLFLIYIFYNPTFWTYMFIIDSSFGDDILNQTFLRIPVIMNTTQCLLYGVCNTQIWKI